MARDRGRIPVFKYSIDYTAGGGVTTLAYTQIVAALLSNANEIEIFDSSGQVMQLAIGPAGSESDLSFYIIPGGQSGRLQCLFNTGMRLALKAVSADATIGQFIINGYK